MKRNNKYSTEPVKVCMVTGNYWPLIGGTERQAHKLCLALRKYGISPFVVTMRHNLAWPAQEKVDDIEVQRVSLVSGKESNGQYIRGAGPIGFPLTLLNLTKHLIKIGRWYDILHVHQALPHAAAAVVAAKVSRKPILIKIANSGLHSDLKVLREHYPGGRLMANLIVKGANGVVALTPSIHAELFGQGVAEKKLYDIPNGVCLPPNNLLSDDYRNHVRRELGLCAKERVALFIGSLQEKKGVDILLQAWQSASKICSLSHLWIVGDGPQRNMLVGMAKGLPRVRFLGQSDNTDSYFAACDVFVLPSRAEGLPNVLLEAMSWARPVIATAVGGVPDLLNNSGCGELVPPESAEHLARALKYWMLQRDSNLKAAGQVAQRTVTQGYAIADIAYQYYRLYQDLLS